METILWLGAQLLWAVWAILFWVLLQLLWLVLWAIVPIALAALVCARVAERALGKELVRPWIRTQSSRLAERAWHRTKAALAALGPLPMRVACWFVILAIWHTIVSLWWTPGWTPWARAWDYRWGRAAA